MGFREQYGPWAVVTGASDGTGREFARAIAAEGVSVILVARREEPLRTLADELSVGHGVECVIATIDLSQPDAGERIAEAAVGREVGLYVSNAGADTNGSRFLDRDVEAWTKLVNLNVHTMMRTCHHFAGPMRDRGRGGVLLVNSGACYGGLRGMATYTAGKAFMLCFAEALWGELRPAGVDVLTMVLGQTDTPAYRKLLAEKGLPLPKAWASPEDVARVALEQLPNGPVQNWGQGDDEVGYAPNSPAQRRQRVLAIGA
jgi:short-subunit dehydrogenase